MKYLLKRIFRPKAFIAKGFTLIELLIVIGILGILTAALVATIDPFEQLLKANDSNRKNLAVEFLNANLRYFVTHGELPWDVIPSTCNTDAGGVDPSVKDLNTIKSCIVALVSDGELKQGFADLDAGRLDDIIITETENNIIACFLPESRAEKRGTNTKYNSDGTDVTNPTTACVGYGGETPCYWCTR